MKSIAILGATGSIGASALDVIARHPERYQVSVLSAHRNTAALADLCAIHKPRLALIADPACTDALAEQLAERGVRCEIGSGAQAIADASGSDLCDTVIAAIVGAAGLLPTLAAARAGKRLLLANKESVVMAGPLLMQALAAGGGSLIPVDSEHNALFQCLPGGRPPNLAAAGVRRLILTASGGPFRGRTRAQLADVTPNQACAHPKWTMGRKISVDSATLMNKGLEVIEAHVLFGAPLDAIDVLVHPQSLVHSLVDYIDGSHLAQLGLPDMRTVLSHALAWPERIDSGVGLFDLAAEQRLDFEAPDTDTFRCLPLAYAALRAGGDAPALLNAANEVAVAAFLDGKLPFLAISDVIDATLQAMSPQPIADVETLVKRDLTARAAASRIMARFTRS